MCDFFMMTCTREGGFQDDKWGKGSHRRGKIQSPGSFRPCKDKFVDGTYLYNPWFIHENYYCV